MCEGSKIRTYSIYMHTYNVIQLIDGIFQTFYTGTIECGNPPTETEDTPALRTLGHVPHTYDQDIPRCEVPL